MKSIKKVLITGAGGFIGSHLTDMLNKMNYDVRALVEYNSFNNCCLLYTSPSPRD